MSFGMTPDIALEEDGERITAQAQTDDGSEFIDRWVGALLEVVDSGRIVVPREAINEFANAAQQEGLEVAVVSE